MPQHLLLHALCPIAGLGAVRGCPRMLAGPAPPRSTGALLLRRRRRRQRQPPRVHLQASASGLCVRLQGVGKGTYSTRIADYFGMEHIASGDLVRDEMRKGTEIGKEVRAGGGGGGGVGRGRRRRFVWVGGWVGGRGGKGKGFDGMWGRRWSFLAAMQGCLTARRHGICCESPPATLPGTP